MDESEQWALLSRSVRDWNERRRQAPFLPQLQRAPLEYARLAGSDLQEANLSNAIFTGADLRRANLRGANLNLANLDEADLQNAIIDNADLSFGQLNQTNLFEANLFKANLHQAYLRKAILRRADLKETDMIGADLIGAELNEADLRECRLAGANLSNANLEKSNLQGIDFEQVNFFNAHLGKADLRTLHSSKTEFMRTRSAKYTDLTFAENLDQGQLESAIGDNGTLIPEHLLRPKHWETINLDLDHPNYEPPIEDPSRSDETARGPELPAASSIPTTNQIVFSNNKIVVENSPLPNRSDLETIYADLQEDIPLLKGRFANVSVSLDTFMSRYATIIAQDFNSLDQVRFGVQTVALRKRFESARHDFDEISPESIGEIEAALLAAELITSRLPEWIEFQKETEDDTQTVEDNADEIDAALSDAQKEIAKDAEHFDKSVSKGLLEYFEIKTTEGYIAGSMMLNAIAFRIANEVRSFSKDTGTEARKIAIKGVAGALVASLGASLAKLAGIMPAEFDWVIPWLKYIPTIL